MTNIEFKPYTTYSTWAIRTSQPPVQGRGSAGPAAPAQQNLLSSSPTFPWHPPGFPRLTHPTRIPRPNKMRTITPRLLRRWHEMLGLPRQSPPTWYRDRLREELRERSAATTRWQRLSETSDVFFSISRAQHDGFPVGKLPPLTNPRHTPVYVYMLAKYTLRWQFYRMAALLCCAPCYTSVREVVNPSKDCKLEDVASRHQIDPVTFKRVGGKLRRFWPLLP